jgi:hypothetical protein
LSSSYLSKTIVDTNNAANVVINTMITTFVRRDRRTALNIRGRVVVVRGVRGTARRDFRETITRCQDDAIARQKSPATRTQTP